MSKDKAIIFDVDGVAVDSPKEELPSARLRAAIQMLGSEYCVSAATGRPWSWFRSIAEFLELADPCIVAAGTQMRDPRTGKVIWECDMKPGDVQEVMDILQTIPDAKLLYNDYSGEEYYAAAVSPQEISFDGPVHFINWVFVPNDAAAGVAKKLSVVEGLAITPSVSQKEHHKDILITDKSATKLHAVAELQKRLNIRREQTIGVGDGHNDVDLFKAVGKKIAMRNAIPELKQLADEVIGAVDEDGLAKYMEKLSS